MTAVRFRGLTGGIWRRKKTNETEQQPRRKTRRQVS